MKRKLSETRGESLTELLVSLLVITLSVTMLAGAVVTCAKINHASDSGRAVSFPEGDPVRTEYEYSVTIRLNGMEGDLAQPVTVSAYAAKGEKEDEKERFLYAYR